MATSRNYLRPDRLSRVQPVKYITENGLTILRSADVDSTVIDLPNECHFQVQHENGSRRDITVRFADSVVVLVRIRRRMPLAERTLFWLVCAESCLVQYLWEKNDFPPDGSLVINELPPEEFMLALHWLDRDN